MRRKRATALPLSDPIIGKVLRMKQSFWQFLIDRKRPYSNTVTDQLRAMVKEAMDAEREEKEKEKARELIRKGGKS